ncbi:glycosyltransferase [Achromobacter sp. NPDC058515]|uniref:glycosyltransferase n=1 Tax=Achromobacter sp. NPDC058515 TaxID=3346533 RepID=UPI0036557BF6
MSATKDTTVDPAEIKSLLEAWERKSHAGFSRTHAETVKDVVFQTMLERRLRVPIDTLSAFSSWAITPELALWILDYIDHFLPRKLVELGSGVSSLVIGDALRRGGSGRLLSIEHSEEYYAKTKSLLESNGLTDYVELRLCPISTVQVGNERHEWYAIPDDLLPRFLQGENIDFLLVDGPPQATQKFARYPAMPLLGKYLAPHATVVLDDGARSDEIEAANRWVAEACGKLKHEPLQHMRRGPRLFYAGKSPRLLMLNQPERNMTVINHDRVIGPMTDYVTDLVGRNLVHLEVAESIALKHQLLLQSEEIKQIRQKQELQAAAAAAQQLLESVRTEETARRTELEGRFAAMGQELAALAEEKDRALQARNQLLEQHSQLLEEASGLRVSSAQAQQFAAENDRWKRTHQSLRSENERLKEECADLAAQKARLTADGLSNEKSWGKRTASLNARINELSSDITELKESLSRDKSRIRSLLASRDGSKDMSLEVFVWVDALQRELLSTAHELHQTKARLDRTKQHLSYRLGSVLLSNSGSVKGVFSIPGKLLQQKREFAEMQQRTRPGSQEPPGPHLRLGDGVNYAYARKQWRSLKIDTQGKGATISLSLLTPTVDRAVSIEIFCASSPESAYIQSADGRAKEPLGRQPVTLAMISDGGTRTLHVASHDGPVFLSLRRSAGVSAVVRLDVMPPEHAAESGLKPALAAVAVGSSSLTQACAVAPAAREPKPMKSAIIWQAHQMMAEGRDKDGIAFAQKHAREFIRPAVDILIANSQREQEDIWLQKLNSYLAQFGISRLALSSNEASRFLRLKSQSDERHESGPLISVIMPAFNSAATIEHSINSILNQTWKNIELFVVDDASEDGTLSIIKQLAARDPRVKALGNPRNVGPYVSKNLALQFCNGSYITGHDADDWAHPDRLARQIKEFLGSGGHMKGNMAKMIRMKSDGTFGFIVKEGKISDDGVLRDAAISCMFERDFFKKHLGHWDCVRFGADSELISRAEKVMQDRFVKVRHMSMICLDNEGSLTNDPILGISKTTGISPTRRFYRDQWANWHAQMAPADAIIPFPYVANRRFAVPEAAAVLTADILENMKSIQNSLAYR